MTDPTPDDRFVVTRALDVLLESLHGEDVALFTTGHISRNAHAIRDRDANFYMIGSMGLLSAVGLGIAHYSSQDVYVLDGDGSALMDLGTMTMIGACPGLRLCHVILDNECYQSTGKQPSGSGHIDLCQIALACGYAAARLARTAGELRSAVQAFQVGTAAPALIHVKVKPDSGPPAARVTLPPDRISGRMRRFLTGGCP